MENLEQMLTDKEVAGVLKLHRSSVWRLARIGKIPKPVKVGRPGGRGVRRLGRSAGAGVGVRG